MDGKIVKFDIKQEVYNSVNTPSNRLRFQKFKIAALNEAMEVISEATCTTSETEAITQVSEFIGSQQAHCYLINHDAHGYAKFVIDEHSIKALETGLHKIKSSLDRK